MSFMFEVYYVPPVNPQKEDLLTARLSPFGGRLSYRESPSDDGRNSVCLTFEFNDRSQAVIAAESLRGEGVHVEGPLDYGPIAVS
jgi:hypothetical protein